MSGALVQIPLPPCGGGLGWGDLRAGGANDFEYALDILENLIVPKSQNSKAFATEPGSSFSVGVDPQRMLAAVDFDDEFCLETNEIGDKGSDRGLAAKMMTVDLPASQMGPKALFRVGHLATKRASCSDAHMRIINRSAPPPQPSPTRGEGAKRKHFHA